MTPEEEADIYVNNTICDRCSESVYSCHRICRFRQYAIKAFIECLERASQMQMKSLGYYVYRPDDHKPKHIHQTLEQATAEAERLAQENMGSTFEVLAIVKRCTAVQEIKWENGK